MDKEEVAQWFKKLQDDICVAIEEKDGEGKFYEDLWDREGGGGGRTRVIAAGNIIEKGGVNFSKVYGAASEKLQSSMGVSAQEFFATGLSIIMHPFNPMVPIIHMNVRYLELSDGTGWFGGGIDLTPHYIDKKEGQYFHKKLKEVCDLHHPEYYSSFKKWADDYFFIQHRNETRGVGGIFFDYLKTTNTISMEDRFHFVKDVGLLFAPLYLSILDNTKALNYTEKEKEWQLVRRGRYVEFNLVWDRGTKFGLETGGRIESILMSLPPRVDWHYNYQPEAGSKEEATQQLLKKGIDWINLT